MINAKCKKCRRAGEKLFLKGERCFGQKCAMVRRAYVPGAHGKSRLRRLSEYGKQLKEKQKIRHAYGISEKQLKKYFKEIIKRKGNKEELLVQRLEKRLDNVVFRFGWACSRRLARQIISHGHILVNGRRVDIPSYQVKNKDVFKIREASKKSNLFKDLSITLKKKEIPEWLSLSVEKMEGKIKRDPGLNEFGKIGEINMILEYYSR